MLLYEVEGETVFPSTTEFLTSAGESFTNWPDVYIPSARFHCFNEDVLTIEWRSIEDDLAASRVESIVDTLVNGILDGKHGCLTLGIVIANKVIEHSDRRTLTKDLGSTQTSLCTKHLQAKLLAFTILELDVVVCECGLGDPLL